MMLYTEFLEIAREWEQKMVSETRKPYFTIDV
jgi:hypothetical protein